MRLSQVTKGFRSVFSCQKECNVFLETVLHVSKLLIVCSVIFVCGFVRITKALEFQTFYKRYWLLLLFIWWLLKEPFVLWKVNALMLVLLGFGGPAECPWA